MHRLLPLLLLPLGGCFGALFGDDGDDDDTGPSIDELDKGARGDASSVWRPMAAEITFMDFDNPYASESGAIQLPATQPGDDGREVEMFAQLDGDTLVTWAYIDGDGFHWRITTPIMGSAEDGWVGVTQSATRILTLDDGHLVEQVTGLVGTSNVLTTTTYGAVKGDFPPASWPTDRVDADLTGGL